MKRLWRYLRTKLRIEDGSITDTQRSELRRVLGPPAEISHVFKREPEPYRPPGTPTVHHI